MRLLDAEDLSSLSLGKFPLFDHAVYLQRQACLKKLLVGIGETKVLKNVTATFFNFDLGLSLGHIISAFPYGAVPTDSLHRIAPHKVLAPSRVEIGRASCRERV